MDRVHGLVHGPRSILYTSSKSSVRDLKLNKRFRHRIERVCSSIELACSFSLWLCRLPQNWTGVIINRTSVYRTESSSIEVACSLSVWLCTESSIQQRWRTIALESAYSQTESRQFVFSQLSIMVCLWYAIFAIFLLKLHNQLQCNYWSYKKFSYGCSSF